MITRKPSQPKPGLLLPKSSRRRLFSQPVDGPALFAIIYQIYRSKLCAKMCPGAILFGGEKIRGKSRGYWTKDWLLLEVGLLVSEGVLKLGLARRVVPDKIL